jgi:hypothetical protein
MNQRIFIAASWNHSVRPERSIPERAVLSTCSKATLAAARGNADTEPFVTPVREAGPFRVLNGKARVSGIDGQPLQVKDDLAIGSVV